MSLEISTRESAGITIVDLKGRATIGADNDRLTRELQDLVAQGIRLLILNLEDLTQVDSSSIGTIAGTFVSVTRKGGALKLLRPHGRVRAALEAMKWFDYISTFDDEAQALASFKSDSRTATT